MILTGFNVDVSSQARDLCLSKQKKSQMDFYFTAGIHPYDAKSWTEQSYNQLKDLSRDPLCVSVGEAGLDYYRDYSTPEEQRPVFEQQVQLAIEVNKPLFLHERQAHDDFVSILNKFKGRLPTCIVHCFTGNEKELQTYLDMGCYIGLTGYLWKDLSDDGVRSILRKKMIPLEKLMIETDAPFMCPDLTDLPEDMKKFVTPESKSFVDKYCTEERNEPCSLSLVLELLSSTMNVDPKEVASATTKNAIKVFGLNEDKLSI